MKKLITVLIALWLTTSVEAQWVNINQTFGPRCFTATGSYLYVSNSNLYRSTNNGTNFTRISYTAFNNIPVIALGVNGTRVFAGTSYSGIGGFYYTTDGDTTWTQTFLSSVDNILVTPSYIYIISQTQVWRSSNNGVSWIQTSAPASSAIGANASGSMVYCGGYQGLYSSNNNGSSWTLLNTLDTLGFGDIGVSNNTNIYVCTKSNGLRSGSIWISTNSGGSWSRKQLYATNRMTYYSCVLQSPYALVGCDSGVVVSRDNGANWVNKSEGLSNNMRKVLKLFYANNYVFASVESELWRRPFTDAIYVKKISSEVLNKYKLEQNYPDPFNPSTTILYTIPTKGFVTLNVYDALGRVVATLVNETQSPGTYTVDWNASSNPSGVYFYRLQTNNFTDTKRMVLIK
jgi:photosystem II stability/assembly factor-like uncharacterized protein